MPRACWWARSRARCWSRAPGVIRPASPRPRHCCWASSPCAPPTAGWHGGRAAAPVRAGTPHGCQARVSESRPPLHWLTPLFVVAVLAGAGIDLWLSQRQAASVARHRQLVPAAFAASVSAQEHRKAADYTLARVRFGRIGTLVDALLTLALTVGGGI